MRLLGLINFSAIHSVLDLPIAGENHIADMKGKHLKTVLLNNSRLFPDQKHKYERKQVLKDVADKIRECNVLQMFLK